jgi:hypothetical protein
MCGYSKYICLIRGPGYFMVCAEERPSVKDLDRVRAREPWDEGGGKEVGDLSLKNLLRPS